MKFHFHHHHHRGGSLGSGSGAVILPSMADHPSALLVVDAHRPGGHADDFRIVDLPHSRQCALDQLDASNHEGEKVRSSPSQGYHGRSLSTGNIVSISSGHFQEEQPLASSGSDGSSTKADPNDTPVAASKRALHLEQHESECPISNPDPHSRPRARQFFRMGRHRYRANEKIEKVRGAGELKSLDASSGSGTGSISSEDEEDGRHPTIRKSGMAKFRNMRRAQSLPLMEKTRPPASTPITASKKTAEAPPVHPCTHRRSVTFSQVQIREYSTILGDHPCCPSGPPISLGWTCEREHTHTFETFEKERQECRVKCKDDMRLAGEVRRDILRSLVVTSPIQSPTNSACEGSDNDENNEHCCAVYSQRDLRRAERKLTRERSTNSRASRRTNRKFFRPLTQEEKGIASSLVEPAIGDVDGVNANNGVTAVQDQVEVGCASPMVDSEGAASNEEMNRMDISPIKKLPLAVQENVLE